MLGKRQILKAGITQAPKSAILEWICDQARASASSYVCLANVHMVVEATLDKEFNHILASADIAAPDGMPVAVGMNILYGARQERVAGPDLMVDVFRMAAAENLPVFFFGSTDEVLENLQAKLRQDLPALRVAGAISPPFRPLTEAEDEAFVRQINDSGARIVFVGLGCPKQERWMHAHAGKIHAVMLGVGAAFPFYTGHVRRSPQWMQKMGLEWLYRLSQEPTRLLKRYMVTNSVFLSLMLCQWLATLGKRKGLPEFQ